ncbi:nitrate regulatory gene2 protein-like [Cucurbita moschata]|uniref:Nitrate regulatory gene2 protein-like n=1 Tax=Cucurbita moschata TaxID=3662 RepID=A0A6J1F875_CUCMO|nr:nitrate regulatory gene2 protein-like [Cucurbita moschata]XP_022936697.1 nitrate regulatory gene2 protein-like [Cucurbita moschata]
MGCGGSKVDELQLVSLCRERKELIKAASRHRYALAAAHVTYFQSLKDIGEAIHKFVDEEIVISGAESSSSHGSPVLTLPSDEGKGKRKKPTSGENHISSSSSSPILHSLSISQSPHEDEIDGHLHLSSGSESESEHNSSGHIQIEDSPLHDEGYSHPPYAYPPRDWSSPTNSHPPYAYLPRDWSSSMNTYAYYMQRSTTPATTVMYNGPETHTASDGQWPDPSHNYPPYQQYGNGGFYGFPMGSPPDYSLHNQQPRRPATPPPPPSPPTVSAWDFMNVFDDYDNGYQVYNSANKYGYGSIQSSPDSNEVREREGIPELEDETEPEALKEIKERKKLNVEAIKKNMNSGEGTSKFVPQQSSEDSSKSVPLPNSGSSTVSKEKGINNSPDTIVSKKSEQEESVGKKEVSFEIEETSTLDVESSKKSNLTAFTAFGTRDLQEVVSEIKVEFEAASSYGKEVAMLLEVGRLPYRSKIAVLKVILSRIQYLVAPSSASSRPPLIWLDPKTVKMAKAYSGSSSPGNELDLKSGSLSSTLEKLYAWEKKLYKEVKDEERLRVIYEKLCKKLKRLDDHGADSSKIDAVHASIRRLSTKIDVCIKAADAISSSIHKLRDEELQPQLTELIHGWIKMWRSILKCHQKQFQALVESKFRSLKARTGSRRDESLKATVDLEVELVNWCTRFNNWIHTQKAYVESLNGWLLRCLNKEPEETADGVAPFSPGRMGAPPVFIICNDWHQAMLEISEDKVVGAIHGFALNLHELWERQDEEQRQRIKANFLYKDFEEHLRSLKIERATIKPDQDEASGGTVLSKAPTESGVSPPEDVKVNLDSLRRKLYDERAKHKDAIKLVHNAASNSIQAGLVPIFEALEKFSSEVTKAHEQVRL